MYTVQMVNLPWQQVSIFRLPFINAIFQLYAEKGDHFLLQTIKKMKWAQI